jgi:hypothetical protein
MITWALLMHLYILIIILPLIILPKVSSGIAGLQFLKIILPPNNSATLFRAVQGDLLW